MEELWKHCQVCPGYSQTGSVSPYLSSSHKFPSRKKTLDRLWNSETFSEAAHPVFFGNESSVQVKPLYDFPLTSAEKEEKLLMKDDMKIDDYRLQLNQEAFFEVLQSPDTLSPMIKASLR
eukprot:485427-Hanusia_phi.AAC.4